MTAPTRGAFVEYDPAAPLGPGRTVIEASAGTGKTFTISALVTRLVAEEGVALDSILVVTFTRAATAELRARVRRRLVATLQALEGAPPHDPDQHLAVLLAFDEAARRLAATRLAEAVTHFDRAQIFTIHGFAQRLLGHLGLRARLSPDLDPSEIDELMLAETASDLIIGRFAHDGAAPSVATRDVVALGRAVVGTPDARIVPEAVAVAGEARARVELAHTMRAEMRRRMRRAGLVSYDDGLLEVADALADPEVGVAARDLLARRYSVALVDESQDTDPTQWQVIRAVFDPARAASDRAGGSRLVVIGDPKQSIYSFRGADVEAYLSALDGAASLSTLATNWRSDGPLIDALDVLFTGASFGDDRITYHRVRPAPDHAIPRIAGVRAPLTIRRFADDLEIRRRSWDERFVVDEARKAVASDVAAEIVRLLTSGIEISGPNGPLPLRPDQIAVLCRTRRQVDMVRDELKRRDVPSVAARTGGVFASQAAEEWRRFLHGIENPDRYDRVRLAAGSALVGNPPQRVAAMSEDEVLELQRRLRTWQELLHGDGVPALFAAVDRHTRLSGRILAEADGERIMTDLTHVAEEMHAVWRRRRIGSLVGWLEATMTEADQRDAANVEEPEARQRRLETDAAAVQVQTVHAAKGLQWPVVLVPYAWDQPRTKPKIPVFHDPEGPKPRPRLIDVAGPDGPDFDDHRAAAIAEDVAEEGRLLYVALTRAEHQLLVWWVENTYNAANSKLHELITRDGRTSQQLIAESNGTITMPELHTLPEAVPYVPEAPAPPVLERAQFERRLDYYWRRASFTSLSPEHPLGAAAETAERPPRADEAPIEVDIEDAAGPAGASPLPMADLPRGARFGTLVHQVLERVPFDAADLDRAVADAVAEELRYQAWDLDPQVLTGGIVAAMSTPLGPEPGAVRLRDLDPARTFDELTFELPVRTGGGTVSLRGIGDVMLDHLPERDPFRRYAATLHDLADQRFRGFLTGAVDLTAAMPFADGERFVVVDYKTNAMPLLGMVPDAVDYAPGPLAGAMIGGNYVLQATLYQVALHRYLQWRLRDYDPAVHLGGAMYLFVRGMAGPDTPVADGERCGVARWRPPTEMIVALSDLFVGGEK
jgi:exodeoxyribonuclease V beta subunit